MKNESRVISESPEFSKRVVEMIELGFTEEEIERSEALRSWNKLWSEEHGYFHNLVAQARAMEQTKDVEGAYVKYEDALGFAMRCKTMKLNNYYFALNRFRIVANRLKKQEEYRNFLDKWGLEAPVPGRKPNKN